MSYFSVIIPSYNRKDRLTRAISSVLNQSFCDYEIIVVDDGSTDDTESAVQSIAGPIKYYYQPNLGPAASRNRGVQLSSGKYIVFLDSDDEWFPWTLKCIHQAIEMNNSPSWIYGSFAFKGQEDESTERSLSYRCFDSYSKASENDGLVPFPSGVTMKRSLFLEIDGFNEKMHVAEDVDLWFRIADKAGFVRVDSPCLFIREIHDGSLGEDIVKSYLGLLQLIERQLSGIHTSRKDTAFRQRAIICRYLMYYAKKYRIAHKYAYSARFYLEVLRLQRKSYFKEGTFVGSCNKFLLSFPFYFVVPSIYEKLKSGISK